MEVQSPNHWTAREFPRFIIEIGSRSYGGQEVPWSSICKLETQESWWYNLVQVWRPDNQRNQWLTPSPRLKAWEWGSTGISLGIWRPKNLKHQCRRAGEDEPSGSRRERERIHPSSTFLFYSDPQQIGWCLPILVREIFITQSTDSNANVSRKHPYRHPQK